MEIEHVRIAQRDNCRICCGGLRVQIWVKKNFIVCFDVKGSHQISEKLECACLFGWKSGTPDFGKIEFPLGLNLSVSKKHAKHLDQLHQEIFEADCIRNGDMSDLRKLENHCGFQI